MTTSKTSPLWWAIGVVGVVGGAWVAWPMLQKMRKPTPSPEPAAVAAKVELAGLKPSPAPTPVQSPTPEPEPVQQAQAQGQAGRVFKDCAECPEMVELPSGSFEMGSNDGDADETPIHRVEVKGFAMGRYEVTVGEFRAFVKETGYRSDAHQNRGEEAGCYVMNKNEEWVWRKGRNWENPGWKVKDRQAVTCVSWNDASAYAKWVSKKSGKEYGLPSEAQWEYGARGGTKTRYYWGEDEEHTEQCKYANAADETPLPGGMMWIESAACKDGYVYVAPVGSFKPNGFGLYDMSGNVWEWVEDVWHHNYQRAPRDGSAWKTGGDQRARVLRGGSWGSNTDSVRSALRYDFTPVNRFDFNGFRLVRTLP